VRRGRLRHAAGRRLQRLVLHWRGIVKATLLHERRCGRKEVGDEIVHSAGGRWCFGHTLPGKFLLFFFSSKLLSPSLFQIMYGSKKEKKKEIERQKEINVDSHSDYQDFFFCKGSSDTS
jgi:hypothetical protein